MIKRGGPASEPLNIAIMKSTSTIATLAALGAASATAIAPRWDVKDSQANCWNFYSDVEATADNIDLESVIGGL